MAYYEEKKKELELLLSTIRSEKHSLEKIAKGELAKLEEKIKWNKTLEEAVIQLTKERQVGFPWLANAYDELFRLQEVAAVNYLQTKSYPAFSAAEIVKEQSKLRRDAEKRKKVVEYLLQYYENIAPFLIDLKEELDISIEQERELFKEYSEEELKDETTKYLTKEEYRKLPSIERNQMALDRYWKRPKSKWLIGRMYERFVGYLYEKEGYDVEYVGIFKGYEDLGRDLICKKDNEFVIIQCKNWSQFKTIYEKHIFQFFGTVFQYKDENPSKNVKAVFYTSTQLSDLARRFASELKIDLRESFKFKSNYPSIKCNISLQNEEKIYHLPLDQQYDKVKVEKQRGEFYCLTVKEAEDKGFRRAYKWKNPEKRI